MEDKLTPLKFYTDSHIAKAVAEQLRAKGVDVVRCEEVGMARAKDHEHLSYATREGRAMVTQDKDFLRLNAEWQAAHKPHAGIMYCLPHLKGPKGIGPIVKTCFDYYELIAGGAGTIDTDIANQLIYVG
jgi:hypothetical protein